MKSSTSQHVRRHVLQRSEQLQVDVSEDVAGQLARYFSLLARWNERINLTGFALESPSDDALDRLLVEPLVAARYFPSGPIRWVDVGSGGGSPAIPIRLLRPGAVLTMIESRGRKAAFLREAVAELGLAAVSVAETRLEDFAGARQPVADWVSVRGVKLTGQFLKSAGRVLGPDGRLLLLASALDVTVTPGSLFEVLESHQLPRPLRGSVFILRRGIPDSGLGTCG